ncbi:Lsr2 family protein [Micromonospora sp. STR1_7]|uniref:Lsr2 family protein n=1 Tax=Micromonospora parastrephiae TaxID=2806101 RepID=A0ABS1XWV0_9ACTN|nr:histone-like nucleoid-structuring protein Lsr2 [Micromonospora parastrephiae]MBM0233720.1 Lsr2 family protein [Micromonospora parastrephiae]
MSTPKTATPVNGNMDALRRAAAGTPAPAQRVPMGIRIIAGPGVPIGQTAPAEKTPAQARPPRTLEQLLALANGSDAARTRHLAERIGGLVEELTGRIEAEQTQREQREAAEKQRAELAEKEAALAAQLAQVRQALRITGRDSAASPNRSADKKERAAIREWALANGYKVRDRGRISREIREAYASATGSEVTQ